MDDERLYFIISIPIKFQDKFHGCLKNLNILNSDKEAPVKIEGIYTKKYAAIPKPKEEGENG
jgi:hypothetical protein